MGISINRILSTFRIRLGPLSTSWLWSTEASNSELPRASSI